MSKYENGDFYIGHIPEKVVEGETYTFTQAFVLGTDTLAYVFNVTMGQTESVSSDQPSEDESFIHRKDYFEGWVVQAVVRQNEQTPLSQNYIQVNAGDNITLTAKLTDEQIAAGCTARYRWYDSDGNSLTRYATDADFVIEDAEYSDAGCYTLKVVYNDGTKEVVEAGQSQEALNYEIQNFINTVNGEKNETLPLTQDVIRILDDMKSFW